MDNKVVNIKIEHNLDKAAQSSSTLSSSLKEASNSAVELSGKSDGLGKMQGVIDGVGNAVGGLNPAFGAAIKGSNGLILKMWEMVANPIGAILAAIVVTLKFLYESFQSSVEGGKELKAIFAAVSAVGTQVKDALFGLGRALIDVYTAAYKFITLDFKGAMESMKKANKEATESYKQLGNAADGTTAKIMYNLERQQQANDKARKLQAVVQSETNKLLVKSRETLTDETASLKDKRKALEEVTKAETASSKEKVRIAATDLKIAQEKAKALGGEEEKKAKQELRDLTIALNEAETENAMTGIKLNKQKKMLARQEVADAKEAMDAKKATQKEAYDNDKTELEKKLKEDGLSFQQRRDLIKADLLLTKKDRAALNKQIDDEEKKSIEEHKKAVNDLEKKYKEDLRTSNAKTEEEKLDLQAQRDLEEINKIAKTNDEKVRLLDLYNEKYNKLYQELYDKNKQEQLAKESKHDLDIAKNKDLSFEARLQAITDREALENSIVFKSQEEKTAFEKENAEARKKISEEETNAKIAQAERGAALLDNISGLLGKQTAAGKAAAVASTVINTYASAQKAFMNAQENPISIIGPAYPYIQAGLAVVAGLKNVQSILSVPTPGGSGGASAPSASASAPAAPSFNVVGNSGTNQLAQVMNKQGLPPVQAYVTANNVTTAQALNRNIVNNATLG